MKKIVFVSFLLLFYAHSFAADGISFVQGTWNEVLQKAKAEKKIIFVDVYASWCGPCKQMDKLVFTKPDVGSHFNENFINYKLNAEAGEGIELAAKFAINAYPTYLFITGDEDLVYKLSGAMPPEKLIAEANKALSAARTFKPLLTLETAYKNGNRTAPFLYEYLERKTIEEGRQPQLLDEYVKTLSTSEYNTEKVLTAIAKNIESVDSQGFKLLTSALKGYERMTERQQQAIISGITMAKRMTFKKVLEKNDALLFQRLIEAVHATAYSAEGAISEEKQFRFDYAKITRNFEDYKRLAIEQADYLLNKTEKQLDAESEMAIENFKKESQLRGISFSSPKFQVMLKGLEDGSRKAASYQLNELAWGYCQMATLETDLQTAVLWSKHSLDLLTTPANLDTYAHLQYRLKNRNEAIKLSKKAIKLGKKQGGNTKGLEESLKQFKKRQ